MDYMLDIETLSTESSAVIASIGCIKVDFDKDFEFDDLVKQAFYVKLNTKEQIAAGRHVEQDTLNWWKRQDPEVVREQLHPLPTDISLLDGLIKLRSYIALNVDKMKSVIWTRGELDNVVLSNAIKFLNEKPIYPFARIRDVRTAIDFLSGSNSGYCGISKQIPAWAKKHNPVYDCAIDAMMLKYYVEVA